MNRSTDESAGSRIGRLSGHSKFVIMNCPWEMKRTIERSISAELQKREECMPANYFNDKRSLSIGTWGRKEPSGRYTVRFYAILYNLSASVEPQSKRFGAIPPGNFFYKCASVEMSGPWKHTDALPKALYSVLLNSLMLIPSTSVVHSV